MIVHAHDVIRERILNDCGLAPVPFSGTPQEAWDSEWSETFERLRRERMVVGTFRYGRASRYSGRPRHLCRRAIRRIEAYLQTGNQEFLVDAANFLMIEFEWGDHPNKHFRTIHEGHDRSRF